MNSKQKGNSFEIEIANFLTRTTQKKWLRVPTSGAFSQHSEKNIFKGDVFCDNYDYNIVIECKSYNHLDFTDLFNKSSTFWDWIKQSERESGNRIWILFFKLNRRGVFMVYKDRNSITQLLKGKKEISIDQYNVSKVMVI